MKKLIYLSAILALTACKKEDPIEPSPEVYTNGILVLNEGLYQQNNASISYFSKADETVLQQQFLAANGRGLGDTANDLVTFEQNGNTFFAVAVDVSSQLEIISASNLQSIAQIPLFNGEIARQPRRVAVNGYKIYSCNYDGTVSVYDKSSLQELALIDAGQNPDGLVIVNDKVYVSNSGGLNSPNYDSTLTIIDANTDMISSVLTTRVNCIDAIAGENNDVYLNSRGDYAGVAPAILRIDADADTVLYEFPLDVSSWVYNDGWLYYIDATLNGVYRYNTSSNTFENNQIIDCSDFNTPYKIEVHQNEIYLVDANNYVNSSVVKVYDLSGNPLYEFTAGLNAKDFVFND